MKIKTFLIFSSLLSCGKNTSETVEISKPSDPLMLVENEKSLEKCHENLTNKIALDSSKKILYVCDNKNWQKFDSTANSCTLEKLDQESSKLKCNDGTNTIIRNGTNGKNGTDGANGAKGEQGIQGEKGEQGIQGEKGEQGIQGEQGLPGLTGKDGQSCKAIRHSNENKTAIICGGNDPIYIHDGLKGENGASCKISQTNPLSITCGSESITLPTSQNSGCTIKELEDSSGVEISCGNQVTKLYHSQNEKNVYQISDVRISNENNEQNINNGDQTFYCDFNVTSTDPRIMKRNFAIRLTRGIPSVYINKAADLILPLDQMKKIGFGRFQAKIIKETGWITHKTNVECRVIPLNNIYIPLQEATDSTNELYVTEIISHPVNCGISAEMFKVSEQIPTNSNNLACTHFRGGLSFANSNQTDLTLLAKVEAIGGNFDITNNFNLASLNGIKSDLKIGGTINIEGNNQLANIFALNTITITDKISGLFSGNVSLSRTPETCPTGDNMTLRIKTFCSGGLVIQ